MIDMTKTYRYRNGEPARILCVDAPRGKPIISLEPKGGILWHFPSGCHWDDSSPNEYDLIEVREPRLIWVNEREGTLSEYSTVSEEDAVRKRGSYGTATRKFVEVIE